VIPAGSSVSGRWGGSYLKGQAEATGEAAQGHSALCALSGAHDQGPGHGHPEPASCPVGLVTAMRLHGRFAGLGTSGTATSAVTRKTGKAEARRPPAGGLPTARRQPRFELLNAQTILLLPSKAAAVTCQEPPLIISRRHSPHHRNSDSLDDRHHCPRGRRDPRVARDGRSLGRWTQTLLLSRWPRPCPAADAGRRSVAGVAVSTREGAGSGCRRIAQGVWHSRHRECGGWLTAGGRAGAVAAAQQSPLAARAATRAGARVLGRGAS
jgi:hypothetical protein